MERGQGALEYLLILGAVLLVVAGVVSTIYLSSSSLFSAVRRQVENTLENEVLSRLVILFPALYLSAPPSQHTNHGFPRTPAALSTR